VREDGLDRRARVFDTSFDCGLDDLIGEGSTLGADELQSVQTTPQITRGQLDQIIEVVQVS
jgi:hypothetical protein